MRKIFCLKFIVVLIQTIVFSLCRRIELFLDAFDRVLFALSAEGKIFINEKTARGASKEDLLLAENMKLREDGAKKTESIKHYQEIFHDMALKHDTERKNRVQLTIRNKSQEHELKLKEDEVMEVTLECQLVSSQLANEKHSQIEFHQKAIAIDDELSTTKQQLSEVEATLTKIKNENRTANANITNAKNHLPRWKSGIIQNILLCALWIGSKFNEGKKCIGTDQIDSLSYIIEKHSNQKANGVARKMLWDQYKYWKTNIDLQSITLKSILYCHSI